MNQEQNQKNDTQPEPAAQKKRNPLERILVWGGIFVLVAIVLIEYRAKQNYDASVTALQEVADGSRDVPIDEARQKMVGFSQQQGPQPDSRGLNAYHYQWFSLLKGDTYQLTLVEDEDHTLKTFDGPAFAEDPDVLAAKIEEANADVENPSPPLIGNAVPQDSAGKELTKENAPAKEEPQEKNKTEKDAFLK